MKKKEGAEKEKKARGDVTLYREAQTSRRGNSDPALGAAESYRSEKLVSLPALKWKSNAQ